MDTQRLQAVVDEQSKYILQMSKTGLERLGTIESLKVQLEEERGARQFYKSLTAIFFWLFYLSFWAAVALFVRR